MAAVPRTASTGAPTSDGVTAPVYSDNSPLREAEEKRVVHRFATFTSSGEIVARTDRGVISADRVTFTDRTAIERAAAIGSQIAAATGTSADDATRLVREYRKRTGSYPDLSQFGGLGNYSAGGSEESPPIVAASVGSFGLTAWLILSAIGLVLLLTLGRKRGR